MRVVALAASAVLAAALAGCGATSGPSTPVNVPTADGSTQTQTQTAPTQPSEPTSPRGNLVKKVGETAGFGPTQSQIVVKFVIDKITPAAKCTSAYPQRSEHGSFLRLDMRVETTSDMAANGGYSISPSEFSTIGPDGVTESSIWTMGAASCVDSDQLLPPQLAPASKYRGVVVLDTKNKSGVLQFRPGSMAGAGGWEWQYGA